MWHFFGRRLHRRRYCLVVVVVVEREILTRRNRRERLKQEEAHIVELVVRGNNGHCSLVNELRIHRWSVSYFVSNKCYLCCCIVSSLFFGTKNLCPPAVGGGRFFDIPNTVLDVLIGAWRAQMLKKTLSFHASYEEHWLMSTTCRQLASRKSHVVLVKRIKIKKIRILSVTMLG